MSRPFIAFYPGDYQRKTQHLTTLQHGTYFLLLQHCWANGGRIPIEPESRAAIARMTLPEWNKIAPVVNRFFDADGYNRRAREEVAKAEVISTKRALAGRAGGLQSGRSKAVATDKQLLQQAHGKPRANTPANDAANTEQPLGICVPIQSINSKTSASRVERGKPPCEATKADLDAMFAARREGV